MSRGSRKPRRKREEIELLEKGGANEDDINAAKAKYRALSNEYAAFSKAMNLPQQRERISIDGRKGVDVSFGKQAEKAEKTVEKVKLDDIIDLQPEEISKLIQDGKVNLTVSEGSQGKHIKGHNNYIEGKSYITVPVEKIQLLVNKYASHGKLVYNKNGQWSKKEIIVSDDYVGYAVNSKAKTEQITKSFKIHYSNKGVHIVPREE